jgi:DNA-binding LytR/AlgR family response regulator
VQRCVPAESWRPAWRLILRTACVSFLSNVAIRLAPKTLQGALWLIAGSAVFWALEAWLLFSVAPGVETLPRLLVFSECVGTAIIVGVVLLRRSRWFPKAGPVVRWLLTGVITIPAGYVVGHVLAFLILGEPIRFIGQGHDRLVPLVFTLLGAGFGLHYFATREQLAKEATARSEAQRLATESQLRLLRAQLEPHMLFNTLANLRSLVKEDAQQAELMIDQLITYLRSALGASRTESTTLGNEFKQLRAYLDIMSLRMGPRLSYRLELPETLEQVAVPPMLLQPLVENAIKHGLEPKVGAGRIDVLARRTDAGVEILVTDTGLDLPPQSEADDPVVGAGGSYGLLPARRLRAAGDADADPATTHRHLCQSEDPAMNARAQPTAVIAEDEPVLARTLSRLLAEAWPELRVVGVAEDGPSAIELALEHTPDVMFLDIKMPGKTGLEVAEVIADEWPEERSEPLLVFVTAYDEFAVSAFEHAAVDYLLKPATAERLKLSVERLKRRLDERADAPGVGDMALLMQRVQSISRPATESPERITVIRAGIGNTIRMIPVKDVICFEATEKYVNVVTATGEALVRMSLRELTSRIDTTDFKQVHRSVLVNFNSIVSATRDENGHYSLTLRGLQRPLKVSRAFGHLFRAM